MAGRGVAETTRQLGPLLGGELMELVPPTAASPAGPHHPARTDRFARWTNASSCAGLPWPFATYLAGLAVSKLGDALYAFALPWLAYELSRSPLIMGTLYAAQVLPTVLFGPLVGVLVDRWDRRRVLLGADILRATIVGLLACLYVLGLLQVAHLYAAAFALALISLAFDVATI